ncbi:MAG: A/G-specific adenine glycosylase [Nevskia sp.]
MTEAFASRLLRWFDRHGRHDLPWQTPRTAYRVWLSEVMLQQTQVATVIPYFTRFVARFPDFRTLAAASIDEVLAHWAGLGYYARGRNLHAAAQRIVALHGGEMPRDLEAVQDLPGVGRSTAAAILSQAYGERHAILDGNVKRVLARHAAVAGWPGDSAVASRLWTISERLLPPARLADYTQAIMDIGATLCTTRAPACARCPVAQDCEAYRQERVAEFPSAKPARARPLREARLLLIENAAGELLIERRPPTGIWGGLWCLPIAEPGEDLATVLLDRYALRAAAPADPLPPIRHAFTHFELALQPLRLLASSLEGIGIREHEARRWINIRATSSTAEPPGFPAPVLQFLNRLRAASEPCPEPSTASSSAPKPKASTARRSPANSASASTSRSASRPGKTGSRTRRV